MVPKTVGLFKVQNHGFMARLGPLASKVNKQPDFAQTAGDFRIWPKDERLQTALPCQSESVNHLLCFNDSHGGVAQLVRAAES